jgi:predicted outer membrane repeat protein
MSGTLALSNCLVTGNSATTSGGAIYSGDITITNCTLHGNRTYQIKNPTICAGGRVFNIRNNIIWGETPFALPTRSGISFLYNDIEDFGILKYPLDKNFSADPCFVAPGKWQSNNWTHGDYHLSINSWCINRGDPNYKSGKSDKDLAGEPRVKLGRIDMGVYEADSHPMDSDQNGSIDFADFARFAEAWLWKAKWTSSECPPTSRPWPW